MPLRPMVFNMDDLKVLDQYTRQYHFLQQAAGMGWMQDIVPQKREFFVEPLMLRLEGFKPGDRHRERVPEKPKQEQQKQQQAKQEQKQKQQEQQQKQQQAKQEQKQKQQKQQAVKQEQAKQQPVAAIQESVAPQAAAELTAPETVSAVQQQPEAVVDVAMPEFVQPQESAMQPSEVVVESAQPLESTESAEDVAEAAIALPAFAPEDMALISSSSSSDKRKRSHRSGRRRGGNGNKAQQ